MSETTTMPTPSPAPGPSLLAQLELADLLRREGADAGTSRLAGPLWRAIRALDRLLLTVHGEAVVAGGWAVWRHGYLGWVTQDVDIVVAAGVIDELLRAAAVSGFEVLPPRAGAWPKLRHKESDVNVDILPEGYPRDSVQARSDNHSAPFAIGRKLGD